VGSHNDLVSHSVRQEKDKEKQITVSSGLKCLELLQRLNHPGLLVKTLLGSYHWRMAKHLTGYSLRWKMKGTRSNHLLFQLAPSGHGINEIEFGLLPTVCASEAGKSEHSLKMTLDRYVKMEYLKMFPTPKKQSANSPGIHGQGGQDLQTVIGGQLNPNWVEWLMGYPTGWTDLKD